MMETIQYIFGMIFFMIVAVCITTIICYRIKYKHKGEPKQVRFIMKQEDGDPILFGLRVEHRERKRNETGVHDGWVFDGTMGKKGR